MRRGLAAAAGLAVLALPVQAGSQAAPAPAATPPPRDTWYEILGPRGQRIGYQHEWERLGPTGSERGRTRELAYRIDGHGPTRTRSSLVRFHNHQGGVQGFSAEFASADTLLRTVGRRTAAGMQLTSTAGKVVRTNTVPWPAGARLGDSLALTAQTGPAFEPVPGSLALVSLDTAAIPAGDPPTGLLRLQHVRARLYAADLIELAAAQSPTPAPTGAVVPQIGYDLTMRRIAGPLDAAALSAATELPHEMMPAPFFIGSRALAGHIRYRFGWRFGFAAELPQTGEQAVRTDGDTFQIDVCALCGPSFKIDAAALEAWRRPSAWIESDAPEFRRAVRGLGSIPDQTRMRRLAVIARARLTTINYEGHVSARTAWRRGGGDCTEDAVVLAALARASGIPARVANGLVYSRQRYHGAANAFLPHSWVVAWIDGRWQSFDISLEGFDASHIALSIGEGEPAAIVEANRLAALLDWKSMGEVRKP